jgi:ferredoxin-NADP reductase
MTDYPLRLRLAKTRALTPRIKALTLQAADGSTLPLFTPGSHLRFPLSLADGRQIERAYSLVHAGNAPDCYEIAVQLEPEGLGGSRAMHELAIGQELASSLPQNEFALAADADRHVLIAGGIGVTPILSMARYLAAKDLSFEVHYVARTPELTAYRDEVEAFTTAKLVFDEGDPARGLDLATIFAAHGPKTHFYLCGPQKMIGAAVKIFAQLDRPQSCLHYELFAGSVERSGDAAFDIVLQQDGRRFTVHPGTTILDVLIEAGIDPIYDCRRGECGICAVQVCAGTPDHRDVTLSEREKAGGKVICTCISRAKSAELVLDI